MMPCYVTERVPKGGQKTVKFIKNGVLVKSSLF